MKHTLTAVAIALTGIVLATVSSLAQAPENILGIQPKFKPTVTFTDTYAEKAVTYPGEDGEPATHGPEPGPQKIAAKAVGDITGFDFSEIGDDMPVSFSIGGFAFADMTLADCVEAEKTGSFPANGKKATYRFHGTFEKSNGDLYEKLVGTLVFSWTATRLTVTLACSDIAAAGLNEIAASNYVGWYTDESEAGNKPSGSVSFANEPVDATISFGSASGFRIAYGKGTSKTTYKKYGSEAKENLEEFLVESATITGAADNTPPKVTVFLPKTAEFTDPDGFPMVFVDVTDTPAATENSGIPAPTVEVYVEPVADLDSAYSFPLEEPIIPESKGPVTYYFDAWELPEGKNTIYFIVTDDSGNTTVVKKVLTVPSIF